MDTFYLFSQMLVILKPTLFLYKPRVSFQTKTGMQDVIALELFAGFTGDLRLICTLFLGLRLGGDILLSFLLAADSNIGFFTL